MSSKRKTLLRLLEFFLIGVIFGLGEDLLVIHFATDASITSKTVFITFLVAFPFAIFTELVVDHPNFWKKLIPHRNNEEKEKQTP